MADPGQNENLRDLLGFDPDESPDESEGSGLLQSLKTSVTAGLIIGLELFEKEARSRDSAF